MKVTKISGGRVIDPANHVDEIRDIWIIGDQVALSEPARSADDIIDAIGCVVVPGLIDMHVHLREPGFEGKETILTGTKAAVAGGFTAVACMPNTSPPMDTSDTVLFVRDRAEQANLARVFPIGCMTRNQAGEEMTEIGDLVATGVVGLSDDGYCVMDAGLMRRIMEYTAMFDIPVIQHAEDHNLTGNGVMHESFVATELGLKTLPGIAEDVIVARDIILSELTGCPLHVAHVSTAKSVELIRQAKAKGLKVTTEVTPHHFTLTDEAVRSYDTNMKMKPPLRAADDVAAIKAGLADGTIDCIATDHAPHSTYEKFIEFDLAPFGILGLETALGLTLTQLVDTGVLTLNQAIAKLTCNPAKIIRQPLGTLSDGALADITIVDPDFEYTVDPAKFYSKSRNTPFAGWKLKGKIVNTIVGGVVKFPFA